MIEELILKFKKNECTKNERKTVLQYFRQYPEILGKYMTEQDWQEFVQKGSLSDTLFENMYANIEEKIKPGRRILFTLKKTIIGIAAIIVITFMSFYLYRQSHSDSGSATMMATSDKVQLEDTLLENGLNLVQSVHLPDSSIVRLFPGSCLKYPKVFSGRKRDILLLTGKATFYVVKDKKRPFTVYAGNTATTALGTVFTVDKNINTNKVNVHLYRGKVVIKEYGDSAAGKVLAYLNPGNEYSNNRENKPNDIHKNSETAVRITRESNIRIDFNNVSLAQVFDSLRIKTGIRFQYRHKDINNISYTGIYDSKKQSLYDFLNTIALLNDLMIQAKDSTTYRILLKN